MSSLRSFSFMTTILTAFPVLEPPRSQVIEPPRVRAPRETPLLAVDPGPHFILGSPLDPIEDRPVPNVQFFASPIVVRSPYNPPRHGGCRPCGRSSLGRCKEHRKQDARERAAK